MDDLKEKSFTARLTRGCVERAFTLDKIIDKLSSVKVKKLKPVIRNILRIGLYQILFMDSAPDFAICNEAVKLTAKRGLSNLKGFVNGVLRNACRRKEELLSEINSEGMDLSFRFSVPEWISEEFVREFGEKKAESIFYYYIQENPVSLRFNTSKITGFNPAKAKDIKKEILGESSERLKENRYLYYCGYLQGAGAVEDLAGFKEGKFTVQDFSSVLAGYVTDSVWKSVGKTSERAKVLDLCAAPGGKSIHLADFGYEVMSCDISGKKTALISEAAARCGFENISVSINDATVFNPDFENGFDIVLCDLPCSGLGIISKKPDIKYNMSVEKSEELSQLQKDILKIAIRYLKKGGILIYSTCTLRKCENTDNVDFIRKELGLTGVALKEHLPDDIVTGNENDCYIQILPGEYGSDGFFISCFVNPTT